MDTTLERELGRIEDAYLAGLGDPPALVAFARQARGEALAREDLERAERVRATIGATIDRLGPILRQHGWPESWPGDHRLRWRATAIVHAVLHSAPVEFHRICLEHVRAAFEAGHAHPRDLAVLTDLVLRGEGRPQRYGMLVTGWPDVAPEPIEDPEGVDERRASLGLPSLAEHLRERRANAELQEREHQKLREQFP